VPAPRRHAVNAGSFSTPLRWPHHLHRTPDGERQGGRWQLEDHEDLIRHQDKLFHELRLLGAQGVIVSSDLALSAGKTPLKYQPDLVDPGVAVYFSLHGRQQVVALDTYDTPAANIAACAASINAIRSLERWGGARLVDSVFEAPRFNALAAAEAGWRATLGVRGMPPWDQVCASYKRRIYETHPDRGGDPDDATAVNAAHEAARLEYGK